MDILFAGSKLLQLCNSFSLAQRHWGTDNSKLIFRRLDELRAVNVLEEIRKLPQARCHELTGDRSGQLSVSVKHPYRLIFEPANDPIPKKADGGLDWKSVTIIRIMEVVDYHD